MDTSVPQTEPASHGRPARGGRTSTATRRAGPHPGTASPSPCPTRVPAASQPSGPLLRRKTTCFRPPGQARGPANITTAKGVVYAHGNHRPTDRDQHRSRDLPSSTNARIADLRADVNAHFADLRANMTARFAESERATAGRTPPGLTNETTASRGAAPEGSHPEPRRRRPDGAAARGRALMGIEVLDHVILATRGTAASRKWDACERHRETHRPARGAPGAPGAVARVRRPSWAPTSRPRLRRDCSPAIGALRRAASTP